MRTTVDLPPAAHQRAKKLAQERHESLSTVLAGLVLRGLAQLDEPAQVHVSARTGLPQVRVGRLISHEDVARLIDEES